MTPAVGAAAASGPPELQKHTVTGQITYRRAVSKKLVFYDMMCTGISGGNRTEDVDGEPSWLEVVVKLGTYSSTVEDVKDLRDRLKLGDVVSVQGHYAPIPSPSAGNSGSSSSKSSKSSSELQATAVTVLQAWRDCHPGEAFRPRPSPLHAAAKQHQDGQQRQQQQDGWQRQQQQQEGALNQGQQEQGRQQQQQQQQHSASSRDGEQRQSGAVPAALRGAAASPAATVAVAQPARPQQAQHAVCKYYVNSGRCAKGSGCGFAHLHTGALRQRWLADMRSERQEASSLQGFAHSGGAAAKGRRAQVFAAWLVETYGRELLNAGEGVLDVAGGAGGVSFELTHVHGIRCTLVDPRPLKLNKPQQRHLAAAGLAASIHTLMAAQLQQLQPLPANQLQHQPAAGGLSTQAAATAAAGAVDIAAGGSGTSDPAASRAAEPASAEPAAGNTGNTRSGAVLALHQVQALFGPELWRSPGWQWRFQAGFSLVIACHPDQATDPALDYALEAALPFAIVPCCVFPRLFPHRRLLRHGPSNSGGGGSSNDGGGGQGSSSKGCSPAQVQVPVVTVQVPVLTYSDLIEYLAAKGGAQQVVLGFEGANTVVYRRQPDLKASA